GRVQLVDLGRQDGAAAAAEHLDVGRSGLAQQLEHVLEELDVAALVGGHGDPLDVLLDRAAHDLADRAVVPEVDDLGAAQLHQAAHDVDGGVVAVEQGGGSDDPDRVSQGVGGG